MKEETGNPNEFETLREEIIKMLKTIYDPEIPVNIYELGLVYDIDIQPEGIVHIQMTLTSPGCPVAQTFPGTVEAYVMNVDGVNNVTVELVWDPPWSKDCMTESARLQLGIFD
jgi:FeS assembly SUF system protein